MKTLNQEVKRVIQKIENENFSANPRGLKVKETFLETLEINPFLSILDTQARPVNYVYLMGELAWYLHRDTNISFINNFSKFWKKIATPNGYINSNYGYILFCKQLSWAKQSLEKDKYTRQAICFLNQPKYQYEGNKDFVCTMYLNFWIRDNKLNMKVQMRSNDIFYGLSYDAPFFSFIHQTMYHWLLNTYNDLDMGTYYHSADNIHYYEKHFAIAKSILEEPEKDPLQFILKDPLFLSKDDKYDNFLLLVKGENFLKDVNEVVYQSISNPEFTIKNALAKDILSNYFYI